MTDHLKRFSTRPDINVEVSLNWIEGYAPEGRGAETFIQINDTDECDTVGTVLSVEQTTALRDHLTFLLDRFGSQQEESESVVEAREEFNGLKAAQQINDLWDALTDEYDFEQASADRFVEAILKSGVIKG